MSGFQQKIKSHRLKGKEKIQPKNKKQARVLDTDTVAILEL